MLLRQLASVAPLNATADARPALPPEVVRDAIDMADVLTRKQVVYFSLPSLEEELTAKSVGKLALYALVHAAKVVSRTRPCVPVPAVRLLRTRVRTNAAESRFKGRLEVLQLLALAETIDRYATWATPTPFTSACVANVWRTL